jgi:dephospho-CoA kinase
MGKYFVSGSAGAGKSSVIAELKKRGFAAFDTDDYPGATRLEDMSGNPKDWPPQPIDWTKYAWNWQKSVIFTLLDSSPTVFVGGVVSNQHEFYKYFDKIFVLTMNDETHSNRLLTRTNKNFGKHPQVLKEELAYRPIREKELLKQSNCSAIDSTQPLGKVVDEILELVHDA